MSTRARSFAIAPDVVSEIVDGEAVVLNLTSGTYFALNRVGTRIWQLLQENGDPSSVREHLQREYEVSNQALETDLDELIAELLRRGLVTAEPT